MNSNEAAYKKFISKEKLTPYTVDNVYDTLVDVSRRLNELWGIILVGSQIITGLFGLIGTITGYIATAYFSERQKKNLLEIETKKQQFNDVRKQRDKILRVKWLVVRKVVRIQHELYLTNIISTGTMHSDYESIHRTFKSVYNSVIDVKCLLMVYFPDVMKKYIVIMNGASNLENFQREFYGHVLKSVDKPYESKEWQQICENSICIKKECDKFLEDFISLYNE